MHDDDVPIGTVLSRREALALLGAAGASLAAGGLLRPGPARAAGLIPPMCVVRPEQTEGPYFVDERLERFDVRSDPGTGAVPDGLPLELVIRVSQVGTDACRPLPGAVVDIWQCDALGVYSDVRDTAGRFDTRGQKFLRGHQVTDAEGAARFLTIFPGWYEGRTVHIHFKIRSTREGTAAHEFTSQLYFDDAAADDILRRAPYSGRGAGRVRNREDGPFRQGGDRLMLALAPKGDGFASAFDIGLHME